MELVIERSGRVRGLYDEAIPLETLGTPRIARASFVEPGRDGKWRVELHPVLGPVLGPFDRRSVALAAEVAWLETHWLLPPA
jgi:hypothetical protein